MNEAEEASKAYTKLVETFRKFDNTTLESDELEDSILARIAAAEDFKQLLQNGLDARDGVN